MKVKEILISLVFYINFIGLSILVINNLFTEYYMVSLTALFWFYMYLVSNKKIILETLN